MATQIGSCGTDILVPEGQEDRLTGTELTFEGTGSITQLALVSQITDAKVKVPGGTNFGVIGKGMVDSSIIVNGKLDTDCAEDSDNSSIIALNNTLFEGSTVNAKGKAEVELRMNGDKFRRSSFDAAKGKQDDTVTSNSNTRIVSSTFNLKKGSDTFSVTGGARVKGTNTIRLGKDKAADTVEIGSDIVGQGTFVISQMRKIDTVTVAGEEFTKKQIANGEAPNIIQLPERG